MEDVAEIDKGGTENFAYGLMAKAYAEHGFTAGIVTDDIKEQARFGGDPGTRGKDNPIEGFEVVNVELIVSVHSDFSAEFTDEVRQIVSKRVVVVYYNNFHIA